MDSNTSQAMSYRQRRPLDNKIHVKYRIMDSLHKICMYLHVLHERKTLQMSCKLKFACMRMLHICNDILHNLHACIN